MKRRLLVGSICLAGSLMAFGLGSCIQDLLFGIAPLLL
jgi:hypothetical protein